MISRKLFSSKIFFRVAACAATLCMATAAYAASKQQFSIGAGDAPQTLAQFMGQSKLQLLFDFDAVRGLKTQAVKGKLEPVEALSQMLSGTRLTFQVVNDRTVTVYLIGTTPPGATTPTTGPLSHQAGTNILLADVAGDDKAVVAALAGAGESKKKTGGDVEEMLVEGAREKPLPFSTANRDLTRTEDDVLPFTVYTAKDIQLSGASDVSKFLQERMPQNVEGLLRDESGGATYGYLGATRLNVRGWGTIETVYLVNGRRMPRQARGNGSDGGLESPDLRQIPLGSIERIEILNSAGSAIYGENATSAIINIITRQDFKGGQLSMNYDSPADVYRPTRVVDFSYGQPLNWGMGVRFSGSYNDNEPLLVRDRVEVAVNRARRLVMERDPTKFIAPIGNNPLMTSSFPQYGATPNIRARNTADNIFAALPGVISNFTTVPAGYAGGPLSSFTPGVWNLAPVEGDDGGSTYALDSGLGYAAKNVVFGLGLDKTFNDRWRLSLDAQFSKNTYEANDSVSQSWTVPANAPINPFGREVTVQGFDPRLQGLGATNAPTNENWSVTSSLQGVVGKWRGFFDFTYSGNQNVLHSAPFAKPEPEEGWTAAFLSGAYNPFVDLRTVAPATSAFYQRLIRQYTDTESVSRSYQATLKASGPVLDVPAGAVQLTSGLEWARADRYHASSYSEYRNIVTGETKIPVGQTTAVTPLQETLSGLYVYDTYAVYAEATVPLLSAEQKIPLANRLELFGSGRLSYSLRHINGGSSDYATTSDLSAYGFRYAMVEGVTLRASKSIGFKPPQAFYVTPGTPPTTNVQNIYDPIRDPSRTQPLTLTPSMYISGGNANLLPELTDSVNFGFILTPRWVPGLRFSADYVETTLGNAIVGISQQDVINYEAEFPGRVVRGAPDGNPSGVGPIRFVDSRYVNYAEIASKGYDFTLQQQLPDVFNGRLMFTSAASWLRSFKQQTTSNTPPMEQVRVPSNTIGGTGSIEWNINAQLRWEGQQWGFGWNTRYFDYILVRPTEYLIQGGDRVPWKLTHDLNVSYRTSARGNAHGWQAAFTDTSIAFGVRNVFDREPRFYALRYAGGGMAPFDRVMGRALWLQVRKEF